MNKYHREIEQLVTALNEKRRTGFYYFKKSNHRNPRWTLMLCYVSFRTHFSSNDIPVSEKELSTLEMKHFLKGMLA